MDWFIRYLGLLERYKINYFEILWIGVKCWDFFLGYLLGYGIFVY